MRYAAAVLAVGLVLVVTGTAEANTVASSTMWFQGALTYDSGTGAYTGTIDATSGTYYMPGGPGTVYDSVDGRWETPDGELAQGGFDVYARQGGTAYYDDAVQGTIGADHDGYSGGGGWGAFYDPDVADYYHYQLTLTSSNWYLEYKSDALGTPMSGAMDWSALLASEDDVGQYRGLVPADPDANDGDAALNGGGAGAWDMDWTWGSEVIPLQYGTFAVDVTDIGGGEYQVSLTPVPEPLTMAGLMFGVGSLVGYVRRRKA